MPHVLTKWQNSHVGSRQVLISALVFREPERRIAKSASDNRELSLLSLSLSTRKYDKCKLTIDVTRISVFSGEQAVDGKETSSQNQQLARSAEKSRAWSHAERCEYFCNRDGRFFLEEVVLTEDRPSADPGLWVGRGWSRVVSQDGVTGPIQGCEWGEGDWIQAPIQGCEWGWGDMDPRTRICNRAQPYPFQISPRMVHFARILVEPKGHTADKVKQPKDRNVIAKCMKAKSSTSL